MKAFEVKIRGIVQGVGFRPTVHRIAREFGLKGYVRNDGDGVSLHIEGARADEFLAKWRELLPSAARVSSVNVREIGARGFEAFSIVVSERGDGEPTSISPDLATCEDCVRELLDQSDRRFRYAFINCTNCGPRYSIIREVPYDRPATTMAKFPMCPDCLAEYENPENRRFHAQPNACEACGPSLKLLDADGQSIGRIDPIVRSAELIMQGKILAVKGIGGFHLVANAFDETAIQSLRARKLRPKKPFAVMVRDVASARRYCEIPPDYKAELISPSAPIVLAKKSSACTLPDLIAPGLDSIGIFIPYAPVHHLLFAELPIPAIIATSGNRRDEPVARDNEEALRDLAGIADYFLVHDRDILGRSDDSVVIPFEGARIIVRRSRGFVPEPIELPGSGNPVLAVGADLKGTFCITRGNEAFMSPYLGDLRGEKSLELFREVLDRFISWLEIRPKLVVGDLHPDYLSTIEGERLSSEWGVPFWQIQHHFAHALSVTAEHRLPDKPALAVSLDGHGYSEDGTIWGGEFLVFDRRGFERAGHILEVSQAGGDRTAIDARRMALSWMFASMGETAREIAGKILRPFDSNAEAILDLMQNNRPPMTSSAGRLFDAFSAIAGICDYNSFEGECPQRLMAAFDASVDGQYDFTIADGILDSRPAVISAVNDVLRGRGGSVVATRFHRGFAHGIADLAEEICAERSIENVILTGGVFQNIILMELVVNLLRSKGLTPLWNRLVPPGDAGVALGQALYGISAT